MLLDKVDAAENISVIMGARTTSVNGDGKKVVGLTYEDRATEEEQRIEVDGRRLLPEPLAYIVLHKPRAVVSTLRDTQGRPTVRDLVRTLPVRVKPIGRLDFHTSGILVLTNDGEFAAALQHPRNAVPKVYVAKVRGIVSEDGLARWRQSIQIDGRSTRPASVRLLRHDAGKTWLEIVLTEGRNRQVRRLGEAAGYEVLRLARISYAALTLGDLRPGQWRSLSVEELARLRRRYGVPYSVRPLLPMSVSVQNSPRSRRPTGRSPGQRSSAEGSPRASCRTRRARCH